MGVAVRLGAAALLLGSALVGRVAAGTEAGRLQMVAGSFGMEAGSLDPAIQKTTKDKLYSKEQAERGAEIYVKYCEHCHTPEKVPAGKKPGAPIFGDKFFENWADRPLGELFSTILNTMPSDGTVTLTVDQTLDVTAHLLKANGFPDGPAPLKNDDTMKTALIVK